MSKKSDKQAMRKQWKKFAKRNPMSLNAAIQADETAMASPEVRRHLHLLLEVHPKYRADGLRIIADNPDETSDVLRQHIRAFRIGQPIHADPRERQWFDDCERFAAYVNLPADEVRALFPYEPK